VGLGFYTRTNSDGTKGSVDLSNAKALSFYAKSTGLPFAANLVPGTIDQAISIQISPSDSAWHPYRIVFDSLASKYDTTSLPLAERLRFISEFNFIITAQAFGQQGEFWIDEVKLEY